MADGDRPATIAGYPVRTESPRAGSLAVRLLVVDRLEDYVDRDVLLSDPAAAEPPYWAHLWTASRVLATLVAERDDWEGKRVVDLGCGLGLPGVVAAMKGALVTAVDTVPEALAMTRANAELNGCSLSVVCGDLRQLSFGGRFDFCFAADITYDPELQRALAAFLAAHLATDGLAWCVESVRTLDRGFRQGCEARGLIVVESEVTEIDEGRAVAVRVAEVRRTGRTA